MFAGLYEVVDFIRDIPWIMLGVVLAAIIALAALWAAMERRLASHRDREQQRRSDSEARWRD